jgi:acyl-CoA reductase-like NAD-dependent aldehyde dehydrogenase
VIERVKVSTHADVDAAVAAARRAQPGWAALTLAERTAAVKAAVRGIGGIKATLAPLITKEMGKTIREAEAEVSDNSNMDAYCDLVAAANAPEAHGGSVIVRHPHGVVSICSPWNYPVEEIVLLSIPALIAGNAIVVKPSEVVPLSSGAVVKCLMEGLNASHPGLVQLLQGDGDVGGYLVSHPDVDMCAFTGSTATGAKILEAASRTLKPVVLECGGKDPMLVMDDADLDQAAADAVRFSLQNCGQVCCAVERVYVSASVAEAFETKVKQAASAWVAGDGMKAGTTMGPCVSEMQRQTVHRHVQAAIKAGARCVMGGVMPPASDMGTFYPPTVLTGVPHSARAITQEEVRSPTVRVGRRGGFPRCIAAAPRL